MKKDFLSKKERRETRHVILLRITFALAIWLTSSLLSVAFWSVFNRIESFSRNDIEMIAASTYLRLQDSQNFDLPLTESKAQENFTPDERVFVDSALYLFPSDTTYVSESDLQGLTKHEVALIRNEIFARHGYIFKTEEFKVYFDTTSWYVPNPNYSDSLLNDIERANVKFIQQYEKKMDSIIRKENFEELVDLGQHPNYDTEVFSSFYSDEYGSYSDFRWEYIGATYSTFTAENGRFDSFDVFKIYFPSDVVGYYLVPFTGQDGTLPIVYRFSEEDGLTKAWQG